MPRDANGEPLPDPDFWLKQIYGIRVYLDGMHIGDTGASSAGMLRWVLEAICRRHSSPGRSFQVQIRDKQRECWVRADGTEASGDGMINLEVTTHAGSINL